MLRPFASEASAKSMRQLHPNRLRFSIFSDANPMMAPIAEAAEAVRQDRHPVSPDNPLLAIEQALVASAEAAWTAWGSARDAWTEQLFLAAYGSPALQALVGLDPDQVAAERRIERDVGREKAEAAQRADLETKFETGGALEAAL